MVGRLWDANTDGRYDPWPRQDVAAIATAGQTEVWPAMPHKPLPLFSWVNDKSNQVVRAWADWQANGIARQRLACGWRVLPDRLGIYIQQKDLADIDGELPNIDGLMALMGQDKKVRQGRLTFILARGIGEAFVERDADLAVVRAVLADALQGKTRGRQR